MTEHAARLATRWLSRPPAEPWQVLHGSAVLADLSGFTRLSEALTSIGAEGSEVVHRSISSCFSALLDPALSAGGDVIGFAGDAALVWFSGDGHERRAAASAAAMPQRLGGLPAAVTGGKRLKVSVGANTGPALAMLVGRRQRSLVLCGPAITALVALEHAAASGRVLAGPGLAAALPPSWLGEAGPLGTIVRARAASAAPAAPPVVDGDRLDDPAVLDVLLSPLVRRLPERERLSGDHRVAAIGFVAVPGIDARLDRDGADAVCSLIDGTAQLIEEVADEDGVAWLDVDVGADTVKFLLSAGAPVATEDDDVRLLRVLRRVLDRSDVPLRAGAQQGRVFAGSLGVPGRRTYTTIGDPVNVAARALALAADGDLIAAAGIHPERHGTAEPLGPVTLRNRSAPVELWRVRSVGRPTPRRSSAAADLGRIAELDVVLRAWKRTEEGAGCGYMVVGDAGMGGSELVEELVELSGVATFVRADPYASRAPLRTARDIVERLAAAERSTPEQAVASRVASGALPKGTAALALAALSTAAAVAGDDPLATGHAERTAVIAAICSLAPQPWLLAVDGLDAVDDASVKVLAALIEQATSKPWFIVTSSTSATRARAVVGGAGVEWLELEPLDDGAAAALAVESAPDRRDDEVTRIVQAARGNPFVIRELAVHDAGDDLPDSVARLAVSRLDALDPRLRGLVRDASAFGTAFDPALIAEALAEPAYADAAAWEGADAVLRPGPDGRLAFRHEAYRRAAHDALPYRRRRELHGRIADHLGATGTADAATLARHLEEAGRPTDAFPVALRAGRAAHGRGAMVEAADLYEQAVRLSSAVERPALGAVLLEQGRVLALTGDLDGAERAFAASSRRLIDPMRHAELCSDRADLAIRRGRNRQARSWAVRGRSLLPPGDVDLAVRLELDEAAALHYLGRNTDSLALARHALATAEAASRTRLAGLAHLHLEMVHSVLQDEAATEHGDRAIALLEESGDRRKLGEALCNSGLTRMLRGDWREAARRYRRAVDVLDRIGDGAHAAAAAMNHGFLLLRQGLTEDADALAVRALRTFRTSGHTVSAAFAELLRARVAIAEGVTDAAAPLLDGARAAFAAAGERPMVVECEITALELLLTEGRAADVLDRAAVLHKDVALADPAAAIAFEIVVGRSEAATGALDAAASRLRDAWVLARSLGLPYETHEALAALVDVARRRGPEAPGGAAEELGRIEAQLGLRAAGS